jgi:hypothetical protein
MIDIDLIIGFIGGVFVGFIIALFIIALVSANKEGDDNGKF